MGSILIGNIGTLVTGDINEPISRADTIFIDEGVFKEIGTARTTADLVIDARRNMVMPGLIDSHVHPSLGDFTPIQNATNWITNYLHGGVTRMVSAGEVFIPGLNKEHPDPKIFTALALLTGTCYRNYRPGKVKIEAGTLLAVPGLREADFDTVAQAGTRLVKFLFYPYGADPEELERYLGWARDRGLKTKIHSGGVSGPPGGIAQPVDANVILNLVRPDIVGHINGGPIPMSLKDIERVIEESDCFVEICYCGNHSVTLKTMDMICARNQLHRVILGTDTPTGTGVTPRAMLRTLAIVAATDGMTAEQAICMATGSPALAHGLDSGIIHVGKPADLLIVGRIKGTIGETPLEVLRAGNLLGLSMLSIDGQLIIKGASEQVPPPEIGALVEFEA
ncbi:MAG: amidohydrolase family protein [Thermodesulfobacteriota bacterium]